ncbi:MAG TPA: response regulator [Stellaceae bacterium]|nr:response regulator [Stellaceae bacterium]
MIPDPPARPAPRVLIAEDSPTQAALIRALLEEHTLDVRLARNGREALALARAEPPDLVITDVVMPEVDGYALCRAIKADPQLKEVPVVLVTSLARPADVIAGINCGADNFITKPYDERELLARIDYLLANRSLRGPSKLSSGVRIEIDGATHVITAEREQMLDVLMSVYAQAARLVEEVKAGESSLREANNTLNLLHCVVAALNSALSEREAVAAALEGGASLDFVAAAWLVLIDDSGAIRRIDRPRARPLQRDPPPDRCACRDALLSGELTGASVIACCDLPAEQAAACGVAGRHAAVPLVAGERRLGILCFARGDGADFAEGELDVLATIGAQAAAALGRVQSREHLERTVAERTAQLRAEIAESKEREARLRVLQQQLAHTQKMEAIGNLTGGLAHDFNNLLGIIVGNLGLLEKPLEGDPEASELVGEALDAAWRGADLTRRLLAFARKQPLRPARIDLNEMIENLARLLGRLLGEDVDIVLDLAAAPVWPIVVDPAQLEASLVNLAVNARDAMEKGGRLIVTTGNKHLDADYAAVNDVVPGDYAMVAISDTGTGMPPEIMSRIFEPFFTTKEADKGTGLGLSMVFGFIKQSNGHVSVYSEPEVGTTFRLYLPRAEPEEGALQQRVTVAPPSRGFGETVLVVEDNPALRRVVVRQLRQLGYRALESEAAAVLDTLDRERVDLLFTDIVMPGGIDGAELARVARQRAPWLRIVLTSGFPQTKFDVKAEPFSSFPLLSKPYSSDELAATLRAALDQTA